MRNILIAVLLASSAYAQSMPPAVQLPNGASPLAPNPTATKFTFVVAGDNRPAHRGDPLTPPLLDTIKALSGNPPDFIVWGGDIVYGKSAIGLADQYTQFLTAMGKVPLPLFNAPGNHEMVVQTNIPCGTKDDPWNAELPDYSGAMAQQYASSIGGTYGMFRYGNAAFLLVNTDDVPDVAIPNACDYNGMISQAQLTALQASLAQLEADATVTHIFAFMHRPIHDPTHAQIGAKGDSDYAKRLKAFKELLDTDANKKVTFIFASHDHLLWAHPDSDKPNGPFKRSAPATRKPTFIVTGGAGAPLTGCKGSTGPAGSYFHYTTVSVDGPKVTVTVNPLYGTTPCATAVTLAGN